ncbi:MAG: hypothetical protein MK324_06905 [Pirellulales bacterium]|nr:hypothetical protein [Pirellulales bacterium]
MTPHFLLWNNRKQPTCVRQLHVGNAALQPFLSCLTIRKLHAEEIRRLEGQYRLEEVNRLAAM